MTGAGSAAKHAEKEAAPWIAKLARLGYAAKGVVYVTVGALAIQTALGTGGETTGSEGALESIGRQPLGRVMLAILALGLLGYALWRAVQAVRDPERKGTDAKGIGTRLAYGISGLIHAGLALEAFRLATGSGQGDSSEGGVDSRTALLMEQPFGRWLVGLVGLGILAYGGYELYRGYQGRVVKRLRLGEVDPDTARWIEGIGRAGHLARGVVFGMIGYFLIQAARHFEPQEARGIGGALSSLRDEPYGPWLLGLVAAGLIAYGLFALVKSRYRRIRPA